MGAWSMCPVWHALLTAHASTGARCETMPISYTIDSENGLVVSVGRGVVTARDPLEYLRAQVADPAVPLPLRDLRG